MARIRHNARLMSAEELAVQVGLRGEAERTDPSEDIDIQEFFEEGEVSRGSSKAPASATGDQGSLSSDLSGFSSGSDEGGVAGDEGESGEDIGGIEADVSELIPGKEECIPTMRFDRSLVTDKNIKVFEEKKYFPEGAGRAPREEEVQESRYGEAIVFRDFFTAGLRFPCDGQLPKILDRYREVAPLDT